jgi:hypothetical protein
VFGVEIRDHNVAAGREVIYRSRLGDETTMVVAPQRSWRGAGARLAGVCNWCAASIGSRLVIL